MEVLRREFVYIWYYFDLQLRQIFWYWVLGMAIGSAVSVFAKDSIHQLFARMNGRKWGVLGVVPACLLGIASPLCMYGTIPIAASFSKQGMRHDWLASFMMASILLNPQLIIYSAALGPTALAVRIVSCFLCGCAAGLLLRLFYRDKPFFNFAGFAERENHDTHPNLFIRYLLNFGRNVKATGLYFLFGMSEKIVQTAGRDQLGSFAPTFAHLNDDVLFGEVWNEEAIDVKTKCIITVVSLMATGVTDSSLAYHLQNAKAHGVTRAEIVAIITHATMYVGWPKGWAVFRLAKEVWNEETPSASAKDAYQNTIFFPIGEPNPYGKYFVGQSYLAPLSTE